MGSDNGPKDPSNVATGDGSSDKKIKAVATSNSPFRWILACARPDLPTLILGGVAFVGSTASNAALPTLLGKLLDRASSSSSADCSPTDSMLLPATAVIFLVGGLASATRTYCLGVVESRLVSRIRAILFRSLLDRPISFHGSRDARSLAPLLQTDVTAAAEVLTESSVSFLRSFSGTTNSIVQLLRISPGLTFTSVSMIPPIGVAAVALSKYRKKIGGETTAIGGEGCGGERRGAGPHCHCQIVQSDAGRS
mmetsp:Transcript_16889/g.38000  ORF Transcript_16889/g.38000 Transcript_16889/m.38000 type:complete len:252 (-) Transcript_16889:99-854(-)